MAMHELQIDPARAALVIVDVQERLFGVMAEEPRGQLLRNVGILVELARRLGLPVVVSEQYPRGLGPTVAAIKEMLGGVTPYRLEKAEFSVAAAPAWAEIGKALGRDQIVVTGMETHVCVYQTVRDLCAGGAAVHVPADAVISRTAENRRIGLDLIAKAGGVVTSTEVVVFDALGKAGTEDFRALSRLIK